MAHIRSERQPLRQKFGYPKTIRVDASSELSSTALDEWAERHGISITYGPMPTGPRGKAVPADK